MILEELLMTVKQFRAILEHSDPHDHGVAYKLKGIKIIIKKDMKLNRDQA